MATWKKFVEWVERKIPKVRTKLFLTYFILIIFSISLVGFASSYYTQQSMKERVEQGNAQLLNQIQRNLDSKFLQIKSLLMAPYYSTDLVNEINNYGSMSRAEKYIFINDFSDYLLTSLYVSQQPDYVGYQIFHPKEGLLYTTPGIDRERLESSYQNAEWVNKTIQKNGQVYVSLPYRDKFRENDRLLYSASIMIRDYPDFTGNYFILRLEYEFDYIQNLSQSTDISQNSDIFITNADNQLVFADKNILSNNEYQRIVKSLDSNSGQFWYESNDLSLHVSHKQLEELNWNVFLLTPEYDLLEPTFAIRRITVIIGIVALLITAGISFFISKRISAPILNLYNTLSRKKTTNNSAQTELYKKRDELDYITSQVNDMVEEIQQLLTTEYTYKIKLRESELAILYSQINPHFLYNTLDMVRAMAGSYKADNIAQMTLSLADMLRYSTKTKSDFVKVKDEVDHVKDYLTIQKLRFEDKIDYSIEVSEQTMNEYMLKMTLQPLIENAVFHGLERKRGKGFLKLKIDCDHEFIYFLIEDTGAGMSKEKLQQADLEFQNIRETLEMSENRGLGIGLSNVFTRYVIQYRDNFTFKLTSTEGVGTSIRMKITRTNQEKSD